MGLLRSSIIDDLAREIVDYADKTKAVDLDVDDIRDILSYGIGDFPGECGDLGVYYE